jgi:hypothetical protein
LELFDHGDTPGVSSAFKRGDEPYFHNFQCEFFGKHPLAQRQYVAVIVFACQARSFEVPAQGATNAVNFIRDHGLAVARTSKHDAALTFAAGHGFSRWADKQRIIDRLRAGCAEILDFVAESNQESFDFLLVFVAGVVGTNGDLHGRKDRVAESRCQGNAKRNCREGILFGPNLSLLQLAQLIIQESDPALVIILSADPCDFRLRFIQLRLAELDNGTQT